MSNKLTPNNSVNRFKNVFCNILRSQKFVNSGTNNNQSYSKTYYRNAFACICVSVQLNDHHDHGDVYFSRAGQTTIKINSNTFQSDKYIESHINQTPIKYLYTTDDMKEYKDFIIGFYKQIVETSMSYMNNIQRTLDMGVEYEVINDEYKGEFKYAIQDIDLEIVNIVGNTLVYNIDEIDYVKKIIRKLNKGLTGGLTCKLVKVKQLNAY